MKQYHHRRLKKEDAEAYRALIPTGKSNAIKASELASRFGCSERHARGIIADIRLKFPANDVILSGDVGYWRSDDSAEIIAFLNRSKASAKHIFGSCNEAKLALRNKEQVSIDV